jgi:hypothetical protein
MGAGLADLDAWELEFCVLGGDGFFSVIKGELVVEDSTDPRI